MHSNIVCYFYTRNSKIKEQKQKVKAKAKEAIK
jgi:hypothetical protein